MTRKKFLINDKDVMEYGNSKCKVKCPKCSTEYTTSSHDYYKKKKEGPVYCRKCNKKTTRKEDLEADPQVLGCPTTFKKGQKIELEVICYECNSKTTITAAKYWAIKQRDTIWTCQQCRMKRNIEKSKENQLYKNEEYKNQFRKLHENEEYYNKVHNETINQKISASSKLAWQNEEKRQNHMAHRNTEEYQERISKWSQQWWKENKDNVIATNKSNFISKATNKYDGKFEYFDYTSTTKSISIKCTDCGCIFSRIPMAHLRSCFCPQCGISNAQFEIYSFVRSLVDCHLNDRNAIGPKEIDVLAPSRNLGIEYNGLYWHSYDHVESKEERLRHQTKMKLASNNNISLIQIFTHEWLHKRSIVESIIRNKLGLSTKLNARDLTITKVSNKTACKFFAANHLLGARSAKWNFALVKNKHIMMIMSFSGHKDGIEMIRMASEVGCTIRGGMSRLLSKAVHDVVPSKILTFADLRYASGIGYRNNNFKLIKITHPNYFYYKGDLILSRQKCQKKKLNKLLDKYDDRLTEAENMFNNGYRRAWDAGHAKFVKCFNK